MLRHNCICQHEINNGLPRTKHCLVPCSNQKEDETCEECGTDWSMNEYDRCPQCFPPSRSQDNYSPIFGDLDDDTFED